MFLGQSDIKSLPNNPPFNSARAGVRARAGLGQGERIAVIEAALAPSESGEVSQQEQEVLGRSNTW